VAATGQALSLATVEAAIVLLEARLANDPGASASALDRASFLELLGRKDEAVRAYVAILKREPTHPDALNALGLMVLSTGNRVAAKTLLCGAVLYGPRHASAHANLAYLHVLDERWNAARALYERALELDPRLAIAHHGLADVHARLGDAEGAAAHRLAGLQLRPITIARFRGSGEPIRILALGSAAFGNVATDAFFDDRLFSVASLVVEFYDAGIPLPPHDVVFNVIGEGDLCAAPLASAAQIAARTGAPLINPPANVAATRRAANAARLGRLPDVATPRMVTCARELLAAPDGPALLERSGLRFPLLVRSPGYHTGDHFVKVERAADLSASVAALPGAELLAIEYVDLRDDGGNVRKYRAIIVDGTIYPLHLAIARHWKIHYFRSDMAECGEHRREDAAFVHDMRAALGARAMRALEAIRDLLGLDYGGIDFALDAAGNVVVFEANASMIVPPPPPEAQWDYRRPAVERIHAAVRAMLVARARSNA
jgi:glutathione synthase/RimK-type ligase-like ATP-grasp enzyme